MPGFAITRGLGGSPASLISQGFISDVRRIFLGATRFTKKVVADLKQDINISIMLVSANGKEFAKPIFNKVSKIFSSENDVLIRANPKKLTLRKSEKIKVSATNVKVRNKYNERD